MLKHGYHNGYSGTGMGTNFGIWVRVLHLCYFETVLLFIHKPLVENLEANFDFH